MPRRKVSFIPGEIFHFLCRGHNRGVIFLEPGNYLYFLKGVQRYLVPVVDILAYCLMPTHYHLLIRVKEDVMDPVLVSTAMQKLAVSYTSMANRRYDRVGALFQGRFQSLWVTDHAYLRTLCIYIHANPVKDGLVDHPEDWPYSNYQEWIGLRNGSLVDMDFVEDMFGSGEMYAGWVQEVLRDKETRSGNRGTMNSKGCFGFQTGSPVDMPLIHADQHRLHSPAEQVLTVQRVVRLTGQQGHPIVLCRSVAL